MVLIFNPDFAIAKSAHRAAPSLCALGALIVEKLIIEKESEKPLYFVIKKQGDGAGLTPPFPLEERPSAKFVLHFLDPIGYRINIRFSIG